MKPEYTEKEQQAINGILDSLPGYKKKFIHFNGKIVGYKLEGKTETMEEFHKRAESHGWTKEELAERPVTKWYVRLWNKFKHWLKK